MIMILAFQLFYFTPTLLYLFFAFSVVLNIGLKRNKIIYSYIALCITSSMYSLFNFASTTKLGFFHNYMEQWICFGTTSAQLAWFFFLIIIKNYLKLKDKALLAFSYTSMVFALTYFSIFFLSFFVDFPLIADLSKTIPIQSVYFDILEIKVGPTTLAMILNIAITINLFLGASYCLYLLFKEEKKEIWLILGIASTLLTGVNDLLIFPGFFYYIIPLSMFAYVIEVCRFYYLFHNQVFSKIDFLESELVKSTKLAEVGLATSSINHDMRNSLSVIKFSAAAIKNISDKGTLTNISDKIIKHIEIIGNIINSYSKLVHHNSELSEIEFKVSIKDALRLCSNNISKLNISIIEDYPADLVVKVNQSNFLLILQNLINNSIFAIEKCSDRWIKISAEKLANGVNIQIQDSGLGISEDIQQRMFERQFTTKTDGQSMGLGLYLVTSLLEEVDGRLYYDKNQKNTTFVIELL